MRFNASNRLWLLPFMLAGLMAICTSSPLLTGTLRAQDPTGVSGDYNGLVSTAGAYDAYTGNAKRVVTDLTAC